MPPVLNARLPRRPRTQLRANGPLLSVATLPLQTCSLAPRALKPPRQRSQLRPTATTHPSPPLPQEFLDRYAGAVHAEAVAGAGLPTVVGVLPGPYANPDYFTDDAIDVFYSSPYEVHYNSNRRVASKRSGATVVCRHAAPCLARPRVSG